MLDEDKKNEWGDYQWDKSKDKWDERKGKLNTSENWKALRQHIKEHKKSQHFKINRLDSEDKSSRKAKKDCGVCRDWRKIFERDIKIAKKINSTGRLLSEARNDAAHLRMLEVIAKYAEDWLKT